MSGDSIGKIWDRGVFTELQTLVSQLVAEGRLAEAESAVREQLDLDPDWQCRALLGRILQLKGDPVAAIEAFSTAILECRAAGLPPRVADFVSLGHAWESYGDDVKAVDAYERALRIEPESHGIRVRLAKVFLAHDHGRDAVQILTPVIESGVCSPESLLLMAQALTQAGRGDDARDHLILASSDLSVGGAAMSMLGYWHQARGRFDEATEWFQKSIVAKPNQSLAYYGLSQANRLTRDSRELVDQIEQLIDSGQASEEDAMYLEYVLGKAFADLNDHGRSMEHYDRANDKAFAVNLHSKPFDRGHYAQTIDQIIAAFTVDSMRKIHAGSNQRGPIFVVGMMRSGTTLIEQILSSHSQVTGAGELDFWLDNGSGVVDPKTRKIDAKRITQLSEEYLNLLRGHAQGTKFVVDKMPQNFQMLGPIRLAFPNAPIIHVRRHPVDNCLSIYTTAYQRSPAFAHSRSSIVFAYKQYLRLMHHWRKVLPPNQFLEIDYEDLTADPEPIIRNMVAFCGLTWEDACLSPEKNGRLVTTPSLWSVRQRVNRSAVERWRAVEPWLGDFRDLMPV